jgi:hypothetical protein
MTVQIGAQCAMVSLDKECLTNRKRAMTQTKTMRNAANVFLSQEPEGIVPSLHDRSFSWDSYIPVLHFGNDSSDAFDSDFGFSEPFQLHITASGPDGHSVEPDTGKENNSSQPRYSAV